MKRPLMIVNPELYRPCVGVMLRNSANKVFMGKRCGGGLPNPWQMPQGGIETEEDPEAAALRELEEETGITQVRILDQTPGWFYYDLPVHMQPSFWDGAFVGQRQKWFLMDFLGENNHINIHTETPEFEAWQWVRIHDVLDRVVPFKKLVYDQVIAAFASHFHEE